MYAEAVPWRCHRSLIGDALVIRAISVKDHVSESAEVTGTELTVSRPDGRSWLVAVVREGIPSESERYPCKWPFKIQF